MTTLITGVDADGKSCVVNQDDLALDQVAPGFAMGISYPTTPSPPPADLVVLADVDHAGRAGSHRCRLSAVLVGTPPPDTAAVSR